MASRSSRDLLALVERADAVLEDCARRRLALEATLERFFPAACAALGAEAAFIRTKDESLALRTFTWGRGPFPRPQARRAVRRVGARRWVLQGLDVAGAGVGAAGFAFGPDARETDAPLAAAVDAVCEQLDGMLWSIDTQAFKQQAVERIGRSLTRHVFHHAIDDAVAAFRKAVPFRRFALLHLDGDDPAARIRYRVYEGARCAYDSRSRVHAGLDSALSGGRRALERPQRLAAALGASKAAAWPLVAGVRNPRPIGVVLVEARHGLDSLGRDLLHVFANAVTQRLVDYHRERRHLAQFFSAPMIDALLRDRDYTRLLRPRVARVAILYADLNSFTKLSEKGLKTPERIGGFVDAWSEGVVRIVWKHGGVFDKMVGDCVIAHFGPPFFRRAVEREAASAVTAGLEIQRFTARLGRRPAYRALAPKAGLPGLGVAVGVNLCTAAVGLFGPNRDLTAFSRGMNETARLQSQAGFRQTVVMDTVRAAVARRLPRLRFEGPLHAAVKNVARPLRFYKVAVR